MSCYVAYIPQTGGSAVIGGHNMEHMVHCLQARPRNSSSPASPHSGLVQARETQVALWTSSDGQAANKLARSSSDLPGPRKLKAGTTGNPGEDRPSRNTGEDRKFGN